MSEQHCIQENEVETNPEEISMACKDVDIDLVRQFFTDDAWKVLTQSVEIRKEQEWTCYTCKEALETRTIGCDSCLLWYHFHCASISTKPRTKYWYCQGCRVMC